MSVPKTLALNALNQAEICGPNGKLIIRVLRKPGFKAEETAQRIAACFNAMYGIERPETFMAELRTKAEQVRRDGLQALEMAQKQTDVSQAIERKNKELLNRIETLQAERIALIKRVRQCEKLAELIVDEDIDLGNFDTWKATKDRIKKMAFQITTTIDHE